MKNTRNKLNCRMFETEVRKWFQMDERSQEEVCVCVGGGGPKEQLLLDKLILIEERKEGSHLEMD